MKNFIKICIAFLIIGDLFYAQQLSKKMGSHVNGERYKGSYKNGLKDGFGEWIHPDGDNYRGKFKAGIKRGKGVYTFENDSNSMLPQVIFLLFLNSHLGLCQFSLKPQVNLLYYFRT